ncbi:hypothetical protein CROQUDRAFT_611173, partial [Cronartium quercuum f. sp. fusiforme G11]
MVVLKTQGSKSTSIVTALTTEYLAPEPGEKSVNVDSSCEIENHRLRRKIDLYVLPQMMMIYFIQFVDKSALNASSILGLHQSLHLTAEEYNWLSTIFFVAFLIFQFPQNLALQRFPIGRWIGLNCLIWAISLGAQAACTNFTQILICRFILGACEGCVTPGLMLVTAMWVYFYDRILEPECSSHRSLSSIQYEVACSTDSRKFGDLGFILTKSKVLGPGIGSSWLVCHRSPLAPWKVYNLVTASITLVIAIFITIFFPSSPTTAWFLTEQEGIRAVQRIKINQTGVCKTFIVFFF